MKKTLLLAFALVVQSSLALAQSELVNDYNRRMDSLVSARTRADRQLRFARGVKNLNPYSFRVVAPGTMYGGAVVEAMGIDWEFGRAQEPQLVASLGAQMNTRSSLDVAQMADAQLAQLYASSPALVSTSAEALASQGKPANAGAETIAVEEVLADQAVPVSLGPDMDAEPMEPIARRPKFWTVKGDGSVQLTQSHYSDNWYQGGDDNFAEMTSLTLQANFNNQRKLTWDNKLEAQLGMQTERSDEVHKLKVNTNLLRLTSNLGYEAAKHWSYTASLLTYTQLVKNYKTSSREYYTSFSNPLYFTLSLGMTYKFASKKEKFSGSLLLAPVAYNLRYVHSLDSVDDTNLRAYHNVGQKSGTYNNFGPSFTLNYTWKVCNNVTWDARMYYYTNFHYALWEWENTFSFTINKYLSAKLFLYPRFDDSSTSYKNEKGSYFMFKEWLSLGLSFSF